MSVRKYFLALSALSLAFSCSAFAQQPSCTASSSPYTVATEGLAELMAPITLSCVGGTSGTLITSDVFISLNTNITNRLGVNGQPANLIVTIDTGNGAGSLPVNVVPEYSGTETVLINQVQYTVPTPNTTVVTIQVLGIRASMANVSGGTASSLVTAQFLATGYTFTNSSLLLNLGTTPGPSLLDSDLNVGFPCSGSTLPTGSFGFQDLIDAGTAFSTVRVTEGYNTAFSPINAGADTGNRILVQLSGYPSGAIVYVPNTIAGAGASTPTSGGAFETAASGGVYAPASSQLLLQLVNGADINGAGGTVAAAPASIQNLAAVTQLTLTNGAGYAVYEVVDSNPAGTDSAQIPIFVGTPASACTSSGQSTQTAVYAPVSTVTTATATDPIPRFVSEVPGADCQLFADCSDLAFPLLGVDQTSITLSGNSQGNPQSTVLNVSNTGQGTLTFSITISYQSGTGWLSASPTSGVNAAAVSIVADPTTLSQGQYQATVTVNAGSAGTISIPVTFNVGPVGVTIKGVVSAASFQVGGAISPNSYAAIFGVNLSGQNVSVTIGGTTCTTCITYAGATQVNFLVPQQAAANLIVGSIPVTLTVDGMVSNSYSVPVATNTPGIFVPGILNLSGSSATVNQAGQPATQGQDISIYMTGLAVPLTGSVTVTAGTQTGFTTLYAGASSAPGEEQINFMVPAGLTPSNGAVPIAVCVSQGGLQPLCSPSVSLYVH